MFWELEAVWKCWQRDRDLMGEERNGDVAGCPRQLQRERLFPRGHLDSLSDGAEVNPIYQGSSETFRILQEQGKQRDLAGLLWLSRTWEQSSEINLLIFGDASSQSPPPHLGHPHGTAQQQYKGVLVLEKKSRWKLKGKKRFWLLKRALRSLSHLIPKATGRQSSGIW